MEIPNVFKVCAGVFLCLLQLTFSCNAQTLEAPTGRVILTISGEIGAHNDSGAKSDENAEQRSARFDLSMLESSGVVELATVTPWTDGLVEFEGVLVRDLLELVKADGKTIHAIALDDYVIDIPIIDFYESDVILATRIKGKPIRVRDNGPLWIIYPWTDDSALRRPQYYSRSIWQLKSIKVLP